MKSKEELWNIVMDIYSEMFKEATPSADFDKLMKIGETKKREFFMRYYLPIKIQDEIIDKHIKKNNLDDLTGRDISTEVHLGCSPNSSYKTWKNKYRREV